MERFFSKILRKSKVTAFIELGRPWNAVIVAVFAIIGCLLAGLQVFWIFLIAAIVSFLIYVAGVSLNDVCDIEVDFINMPYRPLERFQLTVKEALYFIFFSYLIALLISFFVSIIYFLTALLMIFVTYVYSAPPFSLNKRGVIGNFILAFGSVFTTAYSGYVLATGSLNVPIQILFPLISLTLFFAFFTIIKDFKDAYGDSIRRKRTLVVKWGAKKTSLVNILGTLIFFPLTIFIFYSLFQNILFAILSFALLVLLLFFEIKIFNKPSQDIGEKYWGLSRIVMLLFTILLISSFYI